MKTSPWWWMKDPRFTTQMAHVGWACFPVLFVAHWLNPWLCLAIFMGTWGIPKEVWDVYNEPDTWADSLLDSSMYGVGCLLAVLLAYLERV